MVFSSPIFLFFFFPITYLLHRFLPTQRTKNLWLAFASLVFFAFGQLVYVPLLLGSVLCNYLFGLWLQRTPKRRHLALGLAITLNLLTLGFFKYLDFLITTVNSVTGLAIPLVHLDLPIGISFYTFQGLSYVIDVYREPDFGTTNFGKLLLYIAFFPQLIAGPIVLYRDISAQIEQRTITPDLTLSGLERLICGLGKKLILADTAAKVADAIFTLNPETLDMRLAWLGAVCYTLQIYFDFSGYSDMAIGLGRLFGFQFHENFRLPYAASSIKEFWRRWHISLSTWFRDYLYIPLGGNREGKWRTARNKLIVFFLTGLWHGANWTFVLWGLWHGLFSVLEQRGIIPRRLRSSLLGYFYTMLVVIIGFTLFRADNLRIAWAMIACMFTGFSILPINTLLLRSLLDSRTIFILIISILFALGVFQRLARRIATSGKLSEIVIAGCRGTFCALLFFLSVLSMVSSTFSPFIYFQF